MYKPRLFTPGPTPVPEAVTLAMAQPIIHHRSSDFKSLMQSITPKLQQLFCTAQPVITLGSSGTGAAEAAIQSLMTPGSKGLYVNNGRFAARWGTMMSRLGVEAFDIYVPRGSVISAEQLRAALRANPDAACVWLVQSETSTGTCTDIRTMAQIVKQESEALVCVDGVSSVGAHECAMDNWGLDVLITAGQKGLMIPPGLAFVALSERAWQIAEQRAASTSLYFDLVTARSAFANNLTPWTPPVSLMTGLDTALSMMLTEGLSALHARHALLSAAVRAGVEALGLQVFGSPPSHAVTAVNLPPNGTEFMRIVKEEYAAYIAGGQEELKSKIFRIGHLGYIDTADIVALFSIIELSLKRTGYECTIGAGVSAAQRVIAAAELED